ncbi:hypothetical protein BC834DRAFT_305259 [Gloeopeniophorella convolvens]|nr:hypothetical protein BC834DRAFT_305259 [Gloeopeniophorella convolvens]
MSALSFLDLPPEVIILIISGLDRSDINSCILTCRNIKHVVDESLLIQYLIRAELAGVYDPLIPGAPTSRRLEILQNWNHAWTNVDLKNPTRTAVLKGFLNQDSRVIRDDFLVFFSGPLVNGNTNYYCYLDLRTALSSGDIRVTRIGFENTSIPVFISTGGQDDMCAVIIAHPYSTVFEIHILSFQSGARHPLAAQPIIPIELGGVYSHLNVRASITGDHIVVMLSRINHMDNLPPPRPDEIYAVEWKVGRVTHLRKCQCDTYLGYAMILSEELIMLIRADVNALEICRLVRGPPESLETICLLYLPPLHADVAVHAATFLTERRGRRKGTRLPFRPRMNDAIVVVTLLLFDTSPIPRDTCHYALVAHVRTLLKYAASGNSAVPWSEWGPQLTRCFETESGPNGSAVAAQRWIAQGERNTLILRDFNPHRVRMAGGGIPPTTFPAGRFFAHDIQTELPCLERECSEDDGRMFDALIDWDKLVELGQERGADGTRDLRIKIHAMG